MINRIDAKMTHLPPLWISRVQAGQVTNANSEEIRKILGEPIPRPADLTRLKPEIAAMFASGGVLDRIAKKLGALTKRKHKKILASHNTIACVDDDDNIYVGVEFLENFGEDENLLAAILGHEWGHMISTLPKGVDWSHLTWDQLYELRREEEANADGFAGRVLYMMGYKPDNMVGFLKKIARKKNPKLPSHKYHNTATRVAILKASFEAQEKAFETAEKLFKAPKFINQA